MAISKNNSGNGPQKPTNRKKKRRRHGKRTIHHVLLLIIILGVGVTLSLTVFFKIQNVEVLGNDHYNNEDIIAATGIEPGENLFLADTSGIPEKIKSSFPYVEDVSVRRTLPPAISITLTSSEPIAALEQNGEYSLITSNGKVLEKGLVLIPSDVILVKGAVFKDYKPGQLLGTYEPDEIPENVSDSLLKQITERNETAKQVAAAELDALSIINYLLEAMNTADFHGISNLDVSDPYNMSVIYDNRLELKLGTEYELVYKLKFIKDTVALLDPNAHGVIRAENAKQSSRVIFAPAEGYDSNGASLTPSLGHSDKQVFHPEEDTTFTEPVD